MKQFNLTTGKLGENIAREYLEKKGYNIIEQNYKTKYGEIDLICKQGKELVLVEVRTKTGDMFGTPEESLNYKKLHKLRLNAMSYVGRKWWKGNYRVDAVCIELDLVKHKPERIEHYENIA